MKKITALVFLLALIAAFSACQSGRDIMYHNDFLGVSVFVPAIAKTDFVAVQNVNETGEAIPFDSLRFNDDSVGLELLQISQSAGSGVENSAWLHVSGRWMPECGTDLSAAADAVRVPSDTRENISFTLVTDETADINGRAYHKLVYEMKLPDIEPVLPLEILITRGATEGSFVLIELNHGGSELTREVAEVMRGYVALTPIE